jgi:hypothetical protein
VEVLTRRVDWMRCDTRIIVGRAVQLRGGGGYALAKGVERERVTRCIYSWVHMV